MGLREQVEAELSIVDRIRVDELHDLLIRYRDNFTIRRLAVNLLAFLEAPDTEDQEKDDLRMRVAEAEIEASNAQDECRRFRRFLAQVVSEIESRIATRGDMEIEAMKRMAEKIRSFAS